MRRWKACRDCNLFSQAKARPLQLSDADRLARDYIRSLLTVGFVYGIPYADMDKWEPDLIADSPVESVPNDTLAMDGAVVEARHCGRKYFQVLNLSLGAVKRVVGMDSETNDTRKLPVQLQWYERWFGDHASFVSLSPWTSMRSRCS